MSLRLDIKGLADAVQLLGKLLQDPATIVADGRAPRAVESVTMVLKQVGEEIDRNGVMSGTMDLSLTLYAARELARYISGEKTQIRNRHIAEVYYHVLCAGIGRLPRSGQDLSE